MKKDTREGSGLTVGEDLGDRWSRYCVLDPQGQILEQDTIPTSGPAFRKLFDAFQRQIQACDTEIQAVLNALAAQRRKPNASPPPPRCKPRFSDNEPRFEIRDPLFRLSGADITQIDGIGPYTALQLIAEIGTDMTRWRTHKHFTAWLTLAPRNKVSGDRLISSKTQPSANRAAVLLRMCAMVLGRTSTALGAYYRRIAYRIGKPKAISDSAQARGSRLSRPQRRPALRRPRGAGVRGEPPDPHASKSP